MDRSIHCSISSSSSTLLGDEVELVAEKRGANRLAFSLLLKFYSVHGPFPRGAFGVRDLHLPGAAGPAALQGDLGRSADRWRNPDQDLPTDFDARRSEHYAALRKPLDPTAFIDQLRDELSRELAALDKQLPTLDWVEVTDRGKQGPIKLTPLDRAPEPRNLRGRVRQTSDSRTPIGGACKKRVISRHMGTGETHFGADGFG